MPPEHHILIQYEAATKFGAIIDMSARGKIDISGKDRVDFIHRMVTNDVKNLAPGTGCYACLLNAQAKVISDMNVWMTESKIVLGVEPGFAAKTIEALEKFIVTDDVALKDTTNELIGFGVIGPAAEKLIGSITSSGYPTKSYHHRPVKVESMEAYVMCLPIFGKKSWYIAAPPQDKQKLHGILLDEGSGIGMIAIDRLTEEILRIESGTPLYGVDVTEEILLPEVPQMMSRAVSFTKGCFPGQEIVARMDSRQKFAKQFVIIQIEANEVPHTESSIKKEGKEIGWITSACFSPRSSKALALGFVKSELCSAGTSLELVWNNRTAPASVIETKAS